MNSHYPFDQLAVFNHEHHIELLREAEQSRLLRKPNEQPNPIYLMRKLMGLFTLKLYTFRHSTG